MGLTTKNNMPTPPPVYNKRFSTVVPATLTPENNNVQQLTNMDLAMKLHYIRGVYLFKSEAVHGLNITRLKEPMFELLDLFYPAAGRIRRPENGGRPTIRCNDSGVRICEAQSDKTVEEWMEMMKDDCGANELLNCNHALGPDLSFSPLVFLQFTWFKCGGMALGLSWAHILGDVFSASNFIKSWGQIIGGKNPPPQQPTKSPNNGRHTLPMISKDPLSLKRVDPVGDHWVISNYTKMATHSFHFTSKQISHLLYTTHGLGPNEATKVKPFEFTCAIIWKCLAKIRGNLEPKIVTICTNNYEGVTNEIPSNKQIVSIVKADLVIANADVLNLVELIGVKKVDERDMIQEFIERDDENLDFIVYGTNLTFVNLEEVGIYELEVRTCKPIYGNYVIDGVGEEGVVLILPSLEDGVKRDNGARIVTVILPEYELVQLKDEMKELGFM